MNKTSVLVMVLVAGVAVAAAVYLVGRSDGDSKTPSTPGEEGAARPGEGPGGEEPALPVVDERLEGTYVFDRERTLRGRDPGLLGNPDTSGEGGVVLQEYRFTVHEDGTFTLVLGSGEEALTTEGTWEREGNELRVRTTTVNGEPAEEDVQAVVDTLRIEPGRLVFHHGENDRVFLKKVP